jgi:F420-dependent oxidoreductase-like protein
MGLDGAMLLRIFTEPQQGADYDTLLRVAQATDALGFDAFFRSDHFVDAVDGDGLPGPTHSWVTLAGLARETKRIRLGTLMTAATFQLPGPLAVAVATVDHMSGGRVELGIGAGWFEREHDAYGIPFPTLGERFDRFEEQLEIITGLWDTPVGDTFTFEGKHYELRDSPALPKPYAGRPPIIIGGGGPKRTPRVAARFADEFNFTFRSVADTRLAFGRVRSASAAAARARELHYSAAQEVCCGRDEAEVSRRATVIGRDVSDLRESGLAGSPAEIVDKIGEFSELGASRIYLRILDLHDIDHLELIASEVLPHV